MLRIYVTDCVFWGAGSGIDFDRSDKYIGLVEELIIKNTVFQRRVVLTLEKLYSLLSGRCGTVYAEICPVCHELVLIGRDNIAEHEISENSLDWIRCVMNS